MPRTRLTRRRFIAVSAALAGCAALPGRAAGAAAALVEWRGVALGAAARLRLAHRDRAQGCRLLQLCLTEIERLEGIFSLYREESALSRLNRDGVLELPPFELVELLSFAAGVSAATDGAFDVTVQPLWQRLHAHFADPDADPRGPVLEDVLSLVDWRAVSVAPERIALGLPGMAVTLNGIAQGYITDRVADLLRREGMDCVLIDLGEARAIGGRPDGSPWRIGLADPATAGRIAGRLGLRDAALATSGGHGNVFDAAGRHNHLIDPRNGRSATAGRSVSVLASRATVADAASTALSLMPETAAPRLLRRLDLKAAYVQDERGLRALRA